MKIRLTTAWIVLALIVLSACQLTDVNNAPSSNTPTKMNIDTTKLSAELNDIVRSPTQPLASLSVLAVREGQVVYHQQFGSKRIDNANSANNKPADAQTMYRIASISKLITTLGVMRLVEDGKLSLDVDISQYLGYSVRNPNYPDSAITLRMLMNHTSSLRDAGGYYWEDKLGVNLKDVLVPGGARFGQGEAWSKQAKPGTYFAYTNFSWGVVGTVMERATGERFDRLMHRLIFNPMDLSGGFNPAELSPMSLDNIATLYRKRSEINGKEVWDTTGPWVAQVDDYSQTVPIPRAGPNYVVGSNGTLYGPQGNCRLSAEGLGQVMLMLMHDGKLNGKLILKKSSVDEILSEQWRNDGMGKNGESSFGTGASLFNAWGLGAQRFLDVSGASKGDRLVEAGGFKAYGHLGDAWGLTSAIVFNREKKSGMIFLIGGPGFDPDTNRGSYSGLYRHEEKILNALYQYALN
jgi:CubicO group peptidase (beta-lactamase class C family)